VAARPIDAAPVAPQHCSRSATGALCLRPAARLDDLREWGEWLFVIVRQRRCRIAVALLRHDSRSDRAPRLQGRLTFSRNELYPHGGSD
jgi:hypothetical protein